MKTKILSIPGILIFLLIGSTLFIQAANFQRTITYFSHNSKKTNPDNNPDYSNLSNWAAHPNKHDPSDSIPDFLQNEMRDSNVDVFFLHPTTYTGRFHGWNANLDDVDIRDKTDKGTILFQASVFNGSCRVFAPRYRQAHLNAFYTRDTIAAAKALDLAYQDLKKAFQYYLDHWNHGRPIIIASHSQGTRHGIRLLQEFFDGKSLQKQLVCAYLVGYRIKKSAFKNISLGTSSNETGCVVGWRTYKNRFVPKFAKKENGDCLCVNPVTWTTSTDWSPKNMHKGFILRDFNKFFVPGEVSVAIDPETKVLWLELPKKLKRKYGFIRNFHVADYNLFYLNIRANVKERVNAYLKKN